MPTPVRRPVWTMETAQQYVADHIEEGVVCPCCDQRVHRRKVILNVTMVRSLMWLVQSYRADPRWIHFMNEAPRALATKAVAGKLRYWGFVVVQEVDPRTDKPTSGLYRPTQEGVDFVDDKTVARAWCRVFKDKVDYWSTRFVDAREALGKKWSYAEEMGRSLDDWQRIPAF